MTEQLSTHKTLDDQLGVKGYLIIGTIANIIPLLVVFNGAYSGITSILNIFTVMLAIGAYMRMTSKKTMETDTKKRKTFYIWIGINLVIYFLRTYPFK